VAILLADVDRFKTINDTEGHGRGDAVLREVASRLRGSLRSFESAYRLGGEEFLVLLPSADPGQAALVAERLRQSVRESPCAGVPVTISVGTATTTSGEPFRFKDVVDRADAALYRAKGTGRDRVCSDAGAKPADHPRPARTLTA